MYNRCRAEKDFVLGNELLDVVNDYKYLRFVLF